MKIFLFLNLTINLKTSQFLNKNLYREKGKYLVIEEKTKSHTCFL